MKNGVNGKKMTSLQFIRMKRLLSFKIMLYRAWVIILKCAQKISKGLDFNKTRIKYYLMIDKVLLDNW